jgi:hypothetical protein
MGLPSFLAQCPSRLLIMSACSANKNCGDLDKLSLLTENELDDPVRRAVAESRLKSYSLPAAQMYMGLGHEFVREAITTLRDHGYSVSHFILSAGYGFLNENDAIVPYNVTFAKKSKKWIRNRGQRLGLRDRLVTIAKEYDLAILILGREYLEAIGLPLPVAMLPRTLAYIASSFVKRIGDGIETIPVGEAERRKLDVYPTFVKEKKFQVDVFQSLGTHAQVSNTDE